MFLRTIAGVLIGAGLGVALSADLFAADAPPAPGNAGITGVSSDMPATVRRAPTPPAQPPAVPSPNSSAAAVADAPSAEAVGIWIEALGAAEFDVREDATERLSKAGLVAIDALKKAAEGPDLEVSSRAIQILRTMYTDAGDEAFDAVDSALFQLAMSSSKPAARRSELALSTREADRDERLGAKLRGMGAETAPPQLPQIAVNMVINRNAVGRILIGDDWKGGNAGLQTVKRLVYLETIYVTRGANLTPEALADLQGALPGVEIQMRGPAMLGISCPREELLIEKIQPDSAAEKAGLELGDKILKYDDKPIETFDELIELTKDKKVGDSLKLEILRDGMTVVKEIKQLGKWTLQESKP